MKIFFLIRSLDKGGAERQLTNLAILLKKRGYTVSVIVYYSGGYFTSALVNNGIEIISLDKKNRWDMFGFFFRLIKYLKDDRPDILHSYLGTSNIFAVVSHLFVRDLKVVWSIRSSDMDLSKYGLLSRVLYKAECMLSRLPDKIISNSQAGKNYAIKNGFPENKIEVVENGIDISQFKPLSNRTQCLKDDIGISSDTIIIGIVARIDPMKGYETFINAINIYFKNYSRKKTHFICVGNGEQNYQKELQNMCVHLDVSKQITWLGQRDDMSFIYNNIDIYTSASYSEGFSNSIAEAMACGCPCVVTDAGDSKYIVGDAGIVIPPYDADKLAAAWANILAMDISAFKSRARKRIEEQFCLDILMDKTEEALTKW